MSSVDLPLEHVFHSGEGTRDQSPVVVILHGRGADHHDLLPVANRLPNELAVLSLRAPQPLHGGYTWYELHLPDGDLHSSQPDPEDFPESLELIRDSIRNAVDSYEITETQIGLLGFSQGAVMSLAAMIDDPTEYAWIVGLHGYLPESHATRDVDLSATPVFLAGGSADEIIPADRVQAAADRLAAMNANVTHRLYQTAHGISQDELADVVDWVTNRL